MPSIEKREPKVEEEKEKILNVEELRKMSIQDFEELDFSVWRQVNKEAKEREGLEKEKRFEELMREKMKKMGVAFEDWQKIDKRITEILTKTALGSRGTSYERSLEELEKLVKEGKAPKFEDQK